MPAIAMMIKKQGGITIAPTVVSYNFTNSPASASPSTRALTTGSVTASGGGSYAWTHVSGDASVTVNSPSSATTTFGATVSIGTTKTAVKRVTSGSFTADISVSLTYDSGL